MEKITTSSLKSLTFFIALSLISFSKIFAQTVPNNCLKVGQNVASLQFKDVFKNNNGWRFPLTSPLANCAPVGCPEEPFIAGLPKDIDGYPTGGIPYAVTNLQVRPTTFYTGSITRITTYMVRETYQPYALGDYYVFWRGQGTLQFFWNDGAGMINTVANSSGTIPVANGYELNFGVVNTGITAISATQVTSDASTGVHYCRITVPATTGTPARDPYNNFAGIGMRITSSAVAPNHIRGISVVEPDFGSNSGGYNGGSKAIADGAAARTNVNSGPEHFKTQPFNNAYLNWLRGFPVLRFIPDYALEKAKGYSKTFE